MSDGKEARTENTDLDKRYRDALDTLISVAEHHAKSATNPRELAEMRSKIYQDLHTHRRRKARETAKAKQPVLKTSVHDDDYKELVRYLREPLAMGEMTEGGLDLLAMDVKEVEAEGNFHDLVFALARFYRKSWGENLPWGNISAEVKRGV